MTLWNATLSILLCLLNDATCKTYDMRDTTFFLNVGTDLLVVV